MVTCQHWACGHTDVGSFYPVEVLVRVFWGLLQMLVIALILHQHWLVLPASLGPDYDSHIRDTRAHNKYRNTLEILRIQFQVSAVKQILQ